MKIDLHEYLLLVDFTFFLNSMKITARSFDVNYKQSQIATHCNITKTI